MASYTEEQKINYVILLHYRYSGQCETMGKVMNISRHSLKAWKEDYLKQAMSIMKSFELVKTPADIIDEEPTLAGIREKILIRLNAIIPKENSSFNLANSLVKVDEMIKEAGEKDEEKKENVYDDINKALEDLGKTQKTKQPDNEKGKN